MSHQAIYRKYRPKTFDDVIGQNHITETLKNQILRNSTAHAYLFSGIRGTGKTSTAKIFARAVNCTNNIDGNPCNKCDSCLSILAERNMDVIEMDAASNNSVEDIRDLREKVKFLPSQSKYKVYIIDEVHMLSKGAFNALLKTLEEPPEHLLFILATTEPQKIPATILSRCQRFDLKRINVEDMISNMKMICLDLGLEAEDEALRIIANSSEGAMRDALSILDRCVIYSTEKIKYDDVISLLGTVNYATILKFTDALINKDIKESLILLDEILSEGKEIPLFLEDIITHLRDILILKSVKDSSKFVKLGEDAVKLLKIQSSKISVTDIIKYIEELSETLALCKKAINSRILLETRIIKLLSESNLIKNNEQYNESTTIKNKPIAVKNKKVSEIIEESDDESKDLTMIKDNWETILESIKKQKISLNAVIKEAQPIKVMNDEVILKFAKNYTFHLNRANTKENIDFIEQIFNSIFNRNFKVKFIIEDSSMNESDEEIKTKVNQKAFDLFGKEKVEIID